MGLDKFLDIMTFALGLGVIVVGAVVTSCLMYVLITSSCSIKGESNEDSNS